MVTVDGKRYKLAEIRHDKKAVAESFHELMLVAAAKYTAKTQNPNLLPDNFVRPE